MLRSYLQLARPANIVTAWADVLAGATLSSAAWLFWMDPTPQLAPLPWLLLATTGLYAGGVILNDYFDAPLDAKERPERPIPSGQIPRQRAGLFGVLMLLIGIWAGFKSNYASGFTAAGIAVMAVGYDAWFKHHAFFGPLAMGLCRGGNLMLGATLIPSIGFSYWYIGLLPIVYIGAITLISRQEVEGGNTRNAWGAFGLVLLTIAAFLFLPTDLVWWNWVPFWLAWGVFVSAAFLRAARSPSPDLIKHAVRSGVIGLIPLNAAIAALFVGWPGGFVVALLLPISIALAKLFAVT